MALRLEDYAMIGDCETAALVGRDGSIDWLCMPAFDSPACFAAILGNSEHGRWQIRPAEQVKKTRRRYRPDSLVLETVFETEHGEIALVDCMPPNSEATDVVRIVEGRRGIVPVRMELVIRCDYGSIVPWVRQTEDGLWAVAGPDALHLKTKARLRGENFRTVSEFAVQAGEKVPFVLTWHPSHQARPAWFDPIESLESTDKWWHDWSSKCTYSGRWRDHVLRSLIILKALTFRPTGGLVAAPTMSLPERIGGKRNWDYRFCWVRDATFTLYALMEGGYTDEARDWVEWLVRAVAGKPSELQILYGLHGERRLTELTLDWLPGYEGSRPVRQGNAASSQHQLDVYGEVMDAIHFARRTKVALKENTWRVQKALMRFLDDDWQHADHGIWEVRGPRRHFTHSKVMAWVAADRAVKSVEQFNLDGHLERWQNLRDRIHRDVCQHGYDAKLNSFVQSYGSKRFDASLLMLPLVGFLPIDDPRIRGTIEAIGRNLCRDGLIQRYSSDRHIDGMNEGEGAFLLCTFWYADALALQGRFDQAREIFERLLALRSDVGLLSEEYDPVGKRLVGNFPQAYSHVGLINTARNLAKSDGPAEHRRKA